MDVRLDSRTALITGGSLGLGRAMALKFATSGANLAILAKRPELLEAARKDIAAAAPEVEVRAYSCDVRDPRQINDTWERVQADLGKIDILVNNAGTSKTGRFEMLTDEEWQEDLDLKLFAALRFARLALPGMRERRWGRIINVLNSGAKAPRAGSAPTAVSRAAGMALTKVLAGEGAPDNVLVNGLCTGLLVTAQWTAMHQRAAPELSFDDFIARTGERIPVGRMGDAEEFANLACFLASDAASYITGTAINVDGGSSPVV